MEQGTHRDLLIIPNGVYRNMWETQNNIYNNNNINNNNNNYNNSNKHINSDNNSNNKLIEKIGSKS